MNSNSEGLDNNKGVYTLLPPILWWSWCWSPDLSCDQRCNSYSVLGSIIHQHTHNFDNTIYHRIFFDDATNLIYYIYLMLYSFGLILDNTLFDLFFVFILSFARSCKQVILPWYALLHLILVNRVGCRSIVLDYDIHMNTRI